MSNPEGMPMRIGECRKTRRGVMYCRLVIGTRFCPTDTTTAEECHRRISISGDRRRGRWERRRVGVELPAYMPRRRRSPEGF